MQWLHMTHRWSIVRVCRTTSLWNRLTNMDVNLLWSYDFCGSEQTGQCSRSRFGSGRHLSDVSVTWNPGPKYPGICCRVRIVPILMNLLVQKNVLRTWRVPHPSLPVRTQNVYSAPNVCSECPTIVPALWATDRLHPWKHRTSFWSPVAFSVYCVLRA